MHVSHELTLMGSFTNFVRQYLPMILHIPRVQEAFQLDKQLLGALLRSHACEGGFCTDVAETVRWCCPTQFCDRMYTVD